MIRLRAMAVALVATFSSFHALAQDRYPEFIPPWLWVDDPRYQGLVSESERTRFEAQLAYASELRKAGQDADADRAFIAGVQQLHTNFAVRDLIRGAPVVVSPSGKARAAVHVDPKFPPGMADVITAAIGLVLEHVLERSVAEKAMAQSIATPQPFPTAADGPAYLNMAQSIVRPESAEAFIADLGAALAPKPNQPPLIIVSSYAGNPWWGGGFYDSYRSPKFTLTRLGADGYFYIRLNTDRMTKDAYRVDSPKFWAGKIAHELLHNLGYWHPPYTDPANRDQMNPDGKKAFLYAYETALTEFLDALP